MADHTQVEREQKLRALYAKDKKVGELLRELRESRGVKAGHVAARIGISNSYLSMLENGHRHWTNEMVSAYQQVLA